VTATSVDPGIDEGAPDTIDWQATVRGALEDMVAAF
jgi:hypothetical protein